MTAWKPEFGDNPFRIIILHSCGHSCGWERRVDLQRGAPELESSILALRERPCPECEGGDRKHEFWEANFEGEKE